MTDIMDYSTMWLFIGATALLVATPGPVVGLIISETLKHGMRFGFMVAFGAATIAMVFLLLYIAGAGPLFAALEPYFDWIQYIGVVYLLYLGISTIHATRSQADDLQIKARKPFDAYKSALIITASSPKSILFFAAFFPQFINKSEDVTSQLLVLSALFMTVSVTLDTFWVLIAGRARAAIVKPDMTRKLNLISGVILCISASALLLLNI